MLAVAIRFNGICCKARSIQWILRRFKARAVELAAESKKRCERNDSFPLRLYFFLLFKWTSENCVSFSIHRMVFFSLLLPHLPNCHRHLIYRREWRFLVRQKFFLPICSGQCLAIFSQHFLFSERIY